ncbi:MAG: hypothetical protein K0S60_71 [Evtepia sp.]|nr:hypothetical protein [Evtepia sp.]
MPNYVAHELFGEQVRERLEPELQWALDAEPEAFRCGLYGPDPLLFLPCGLHLSRLLHNTWKQNSAPKMQSMLEQGSAGEKSFAAGYLCHLILDDLCHHRIYRLMKEDGLSHRCLEVGLDWLILKKSGELRFPVPYVEEKKRISEFAAELIHPVKPLEYRMGLASMGLLCKQMTQVGKFYRRKLTLGYREPVGELFRILEETIDNAVSLIGQFAAGDLVLVEGELVGAY